MRLLLVEDDVMLGSGIRFGLRQDDFVVDWVQGRCAAESALQSQPYSVVILDLGLPGNQAFAVLESLHRLKNPTPVVIINGGYDLRRSVRSRPARVAHPGCTAPAGEPRRAREYDDRPAFLVGLISARRSAFG